MDLFQCEKEQHGCWGFFKSFPAKVQELKKSDGF